MVTSYWSIGQVIVEDEQKGNERAEYGKAVLEDMTLSFVQKQNWISLINTMSAAKNMADICKILSGRM